MQLRSRENLMDLCIHVGVEVLCMEPLSRYVCMKYFGYFGRAPSILRARAKHTSGARQAYFGRAPSILRARAKHTSGARKAYFGRAQSILIYQHQAFAANRAGEAYLCYDVNIGAPRQFTERRHLQQRRRRRKYQRCIHIHEHKMMTTY
jgi:hypothetical protein